MVIIDDEKEQVEGIKTIIDWNKYDVKICGTAGNGKDGLTLIENEAPDIAIIDIKMPMMNGLELIEEISKRKITIQYIILSGYDDFYYAQKAIELKTSNYLLKPCRPEEILQSVLKAINNIVEEKKKINILTNYQEIISRNISILKENFLIKLITGQITDNNIIQSKITNYKLTLSGPDTSSHYCAILFVYDYSLSLGPEQSDEKNELITMAVREMIEKSFLQEYSCETLYYNNDIVAILEIEEKSDYCNKLFNNLEKIKTNINENYSLSFIIAIGNPVPSLDLIWKSYKQAEIALETRFFSSENEIVYYESMMSEENTEFLYPIQEEHKILSFLEQGNEEKIENAIQAFFDNLYIEKKVSKKYIQTLSLTLLSNILHFCINKGIDFNSLEFDILNAFDDIFKSKTIEQLQDKIIFILTSIIKTIKTNRNYNETVEYTLNYILKNYQNNITLQEIADKVNYSPGYLSLLFKQETGTNFIDYLNRYRINKAKSLLKDTNYKNYEIAYKVGYQDEKYFYQVFKKYTGLTASQYRESINMYK